ncbi:histidinol-phosphate transaminase [Desulfocurvus sp.]|jgi:histidinol-phosphate aminotransferase|uniref:histidinol-phosphate transaminase n=1 Tax=Desulfocurvus sp. TaxID=2871698 RepID=UPI0025BC2B46|nr:histidinol-phosphate transaminase [Desulfocurvus sp.]MCK9241025.1 histidinol-phosphate transaminase [Desulfocurvus sp.]
MDDIRRVRPEVEDFEAYSPGLTIDEIKARFGLDAVIKMASNENPLGTSPVVQKVLCDKAGLAFRYAQAGTPRLAAAIAGHHGLPAGRVVAGNGSDEIIDLLIRVKARPGRDNIIAFKPCFAMYRLQARLCGVEFRQAPLGPGFSFDPDALLALADENTAICFVTTPDNPSGYAPPVAVLERLARELPPQCLLVLDEAYMDFAEPQEAYSLLPRLEEFPRVAVLRTFSKMYGLAGLRLGYGLLPEWLADYCLRVKPPFSVNILAEEAGLAALRDDDFVRATREAVRRGREFLARELGALGCTVWPSQANFFIMDLPAGAALDAKGVFEALLARGIILRPLASYGLAASLRVSVGNEQENAALVRALAEVLA